MYLRLCENKTEHTKLGNFCLAFGLFSMYASSSFFPWDTIQENEFLGSLAGSIQFAFRFLPFATVFLCVVSALGIYCFFESAEQKQLLFAACTVLAVYSSGIYLSNYTSQADLYVTQETQLDLSHETDFIYLFDNNGEYFSVRKVQQQIASFETSEGVILTDCYRNGTHAGFTYTKTGNTSSAYVDVSFNNYPYYHAYDSNGVRLETGLNELLRLRVYLPDAASDTISIHFELPEIYRTFDYISLTTALVFVLCLCYNRLSLCAKRIKLRR